MSMRAVDGKLECRLTRPLVLEVYRAENRGNFTFDLNKEYYLFLAWGSVYESKNNRSLICKTVQTEHRLQF